MTKLGVDSSVHDLSALRVIDCTGSALPATAYSGHRMKPPLFARRALMTNTALTGAT
ncbi:hypothetical protein [Streptomyces sp. NPDC046759]|uniref:hypothetical protein n=1 Tax=Streptomyces sp. NPDC046759 TaxID=3155019 RepID=UPI003406EE90